MITQQDILNHCIASYERFVKEAPQKEDVRAYLSYNHAQFGVCHFIKKVFGDYFGEYSTKWIYKASRYDFVYWCDTPSVLCSREEIIKSLEIRLSILKSVKL